MPIAPVMQFAPETEAEANPWYTAMKQFSDIGKQRQAQQLAQESAQRQQLLFPEKLKLLQAKIQRDQALAKDPFGGKFAPGAAGKVEGLEFIRNKYGENSPQYKEAVRGYNAAVGEQVAKTGYYGSNVWAKNLTSVGRDMIAGQKALEAGNTKLANAYFAAAQKQTSDSKTRAQALNAQQIVQATNKVPVGVLEEFGGLRGRANLWGDRLRHMLTGKEYSPDYLKYQTFESNTKNMMIDTIRQALQTSVMPSYVTKYIAPMADPTSNIWNDPAAVKAVWDKFQNYMHEYAVNRTKAVTQGIPTTVPAITTPSASEPAPPQVPRRTSDTDPFSGMGGNPLGIGGSK